MANTLEQIQQGLISQATGAQGKLTLDNSVIASDCYANILAAASVKQIAVQVSATQPANDIFIQNGSLFVKGSASLYGSAVTAFQLQLTGEDESSRTAQLTGTLASLDITQLKTLNLISANPILPPLTFSNVSITALSNPPLSTVANITLAVQTNTGSWDILPDLGFSLTGMGMSLLRDQMGNSSMGITGNFLIPNTPSGKQVNVTVTIPVSSFVLPVWGITLTGGQNQPLIGLGDISTLLAGTNVFSQLPPGLSEVGNFGLTAINVSFTQSQSGFSVSSVAATVGCSNWNVGPQDKPIFTITSVGFTINVQNPFDSANRRISALVFGNFQIDPADSSTNLSIQMSIPAGNADWVLNAYGEVDLKNVSVFNQLPGGFNSGNINLPAEVSGASLQINYFTISFSPSSLQLSFIRFSLLLKATWWIIENEFGIANPMLEVYIPGASLPSPPPLRVAAAGEILLPDNVVLDLDASYEKGGPWSFAAALAPGSQVNLIKLVQQLIGSDINPDSSLGLDKLMITAFAMSVVSDPSTQQTTYSLSGTTVADWNTSFGSLPTISASASLAITYNTQNGTSGSIAVTLDIFDIEFTVKYNFTPKNFTLELDWKGFVFTYDNSQNTITATGGDWSVGSLLTALINEIDPSQDFSLPDPWSMLNSISLKGLSLTINLTTKQFSFTYTLGSPIKLFFITITGFTFNVENGSVMVNIDGTFLGGGKIPAWDAVNDAPPAVPGSGKDLFDLKFLAIGQHVSLTGLGTVKTVQDALANYEQYLAPPTQSSTKIPVGKTPANPPQGTLVFDASSSWLIAADCTIAQFYQLQFVFNDPDLYGLRIGIASGASYFKNLAFEIMYKKISDTIGMYQLNLQLPDEFRHLEFGEVSVTLPNIGIQVYTNGNFYLDFGFPASISDFSRSFAIQVFPFVGYGGFYFGMLSGATSTQVPKTTYGQFNPVIEAGLGLSIGVGKTIDEGILSAGLSLTVVGIFEGVLGFYTCYADSSKTAVYYRFQATVGIVGHIYGQVNFAIISAQFDLLAYIYASIIIESYKPIPISFKAGVTIKLTIKINLGLFKISISLSFSATISASFTIGSDTSANALWNNPCTGTSRQLAAALAATQYKIVWQPLAYDSGLPAAPFINLLFIPHLSVDNESGNQQQAQYAAMLYIDAPAATDTTDSSSLGSLAQGVLAWAINAVVNSSTTGTKYSQLLTQDVTAEQLTALMCVFNNQQDNLPPFNYHNPITEGNDVKGFLQAFFYNGQQSTINVVAVAPDTDTTINAAVFPPFPDLQLLAKVNDNNVASTDFSTQSMTGDKNYISDVTAMLNLLNVNYLGGTAAGGGSNPICDNVDNSGSPVLTNLSLPTFFFTDFISLVAKQMIQNSLDYLNSQGLSSIAVGTLLGKVCTVGNTLSLSGMASRFLLHGLRLPAPPVAATGTVQPLYVLTGQQFAIPATLQSTDNFVVSLTKATDTSWICFDGSPTGTTLPITVDSTEITRIIQTAGVTMTPTIEAGFPKAAPMFYDGQQAFTLGSPALWQYPGQYYSGLANQPYVFKLPSNLQQELAGYSGATPVFTVQYIDRTAANPQPENIVHYTWATAVDITVQKITGEGAAASPLQGNMYNLTGADDTGVFFLESLVAYLNSSADKGFTGTVQLLYQADPANNSNGGFISTLNNTNIPPAPPNQVSMAIVQANLSTETNPEQAFMRFAAMPQDAAAPSNILNSFQDFVTLLWECSIVRSGGFYFYYNNVAGGNAGLPDALFNGSMSARLQVLITYNSFVPATFLNSMVIGDALNYSNASVFAQSASFGLRSALLPQGTVGYIMQRAVPGQYVPPTDPTQPPSTTDDELYLENQFNLVGITVPGASPAYPNLLPSGPVDGDNTGADVKTADDGIWNYTGTVPFNRFVAGLTVKWGIADPYAGLGSTAAMQLNWQDMFGNVLPLGGTQQQVTVPIGYTDNIVAVSQWPSASASYTFSGDGTVSPVFSLVLGFDASKYNTGDQTAINNAAADLLTWARLWYQLNRPADMEMDYTVSINATQNSPAGTVQPVDLGKLQSSFVEPIANYLYAIATGTTPPAVPAPYTLSFTVDPASVTSYTYIFALTTAINIRRTQHIDPGFTGVPGVAFASTTVQPQVQSGGGASSLQVFAQQFEQAFNMPGATLLYKVATSTNLSTSSSDPVAAPPLWIIRFDTAGSSGIGITYHTTNGSNPLASFFAPIPLATSLQSFSAGIVPYATGVPFNPAGSGTTTNFSSVDLDNWGLQVLQAVDKFLSPAYAVPAFLLDNGASLQQVLDAKQQIAQGITGTVDYIISNDDAAKLASVGNAQEKWYQQLLIQLSAAYNYTAAVQTPVTVQSCWSGPNTDPPVQGAPPRLYGKIIGTLAADNINGTDISPEQNANFSAAKLPVAAGASWLTSMFQIENGQMQNITFSPLEFAVSHVEWQYEAVEGIDGYLSSSWLLIVNPQTLPAQYTNAGEMQIPIPLKAYPTPPSVSGQGANYPSQTPPASTNPVAVARSWDYTCSYQAPAVPQDTTIMQVQLNVAPDSKAKRALAAAPIPTLDQAMAQFMSMYTQLSSDFDSYLLNVKSADDPNAKNAANAVNAFISVLGIIGTAWNNWNQVNPFRPNLLLKAGGSKLAAPVPAKVIQLYTLEETSAGLNPPPPLAAGQLLINVSAAAANPISGLLPLIDIEGYTRSAMVTGNVTSYSYINTSTGAPLLYTSRNLVPIRNTTLPALDLFNLQNAGAGLQLQRNLDLLPLPGSTTQWQTTNPLFVYQTPMVMFYSIYQPLFAAADGINIAQIPSPGGGTPPAQRTLGDQLAAWAAALTANVNGIDTLTVKLECLYSYQAGNTGLTLSIPVLLLPPYPLTLSDKGAAFATMLTGNIGTWFKQHNPGTNQGQWLFNLQVYSSFGTNLPMLSREFYLQLSSVLPG